MKSGPNYVGGTYEASGTGDDPWTLPAVSPTNAGTTTFNVPANTGGSRITHYVATASPGGITSGAFFTQKTAYEIRIRDWSSDVCSSD
eukprot:COSAG02_NODE_51779_length_312_cov_0.629108_1_plen_87_part_10